MIDYRNGLDLAFPLNSSKMKMRLSSPHEQSAAAGRSSRDRNPCAARPADVLPTGGAQLLTGGVGVLAAYPITGLGRRVNSNGTSRSASPLRHGCGPHGSFERPPTCLASNVLAIRRCICCCKRVSKFSIEKFTVGVRRKTAGVAPYGDSP